jgi:hypothetical protein
MNQPRRLTEAQKREVCSIVLLGCDRVTACYFLGLDPEQLRREMADDAVFARQVLRAAASVEMHHMRCLHQASQDPKQWRVAQWWLERRAPDRYAARRPNAISHEQLDTLLDRIAQIIVAEVSDEGLALRLLDRLEAASEPSSFEQPAEGAEGSDTDHDGEGSETSLLRLFDSSE